jgi:hypothetical protein
MRLPRVRRQVQNPQVLAVRTPRLLFPQGVIGAPKQHRRVQILPVHVPRERSGLSHQPVDHVPIVDPMFRLATQPLHRLHPHARVPHLDLFRADTRFHPLSPQPRRHRVRVLLHLDRAALADPRRLTLKCFQPPRGQGTQPRLLLPKLLGPAPVPLGHQHAQQLPVLLPTGEFPAATHQQFLLHRFLETPMALLAVAVLVPAISIRGLRRHLVVTQQRLIPGRVPLGVPVVVNGQRHAVGAVTLGHGAQFPNGVLQPLAQAGEALREAQRHVLPIRIGEHEVVHQVRKRLALDGNAQAIHVREVRRAQPTRLMHLAEKDFLGGAVPRLPLPYPSFQRPPVPLPVLAGMLAFQPFHQLFRLQARRTFQQFLHLRPDRRQRIHARPPAMGPARLAGKSSQLAIFPG